MVKVSPIVSVVATILIAAYVTWVAATKTENYQKRRSSAPFRRLSGVTYDSTAHNRQGRRGNGQKKKKQEIKDALDKHDKWKPKGEDRSGLKLQVLNNLDADSDWDEYLKTSVGEWNDSPSVTLSFRTMTYDPECRAIPWAIKMCNDNFGPTSWKGVTQVLFQGEYIVASLAKMNDYYLRNMDNANKLYTVCHELGHGLGLAHSDERYNNADLGNCMDYTNNHEINMHPGQSNFKILRQMYGRVRPNGGGRYLRVKTIDAPGDGTVNEKEERLRLKEFDKYAAYFLDLIDVSTNDESQQPDPKRKWRLLSKTDKVECHERQLENQYSIRTNILLT